MPGCGDESRRRDPAACPALRPDGVLAPRRRALTIGLVLLVTLIAFELLAVSTVMPEVAADLQGIALYGWVFSAFFLANLVGITVAGSVLDRGGWRPRS